MNIQAQNNCEVRTKNYPGWQSNPRATLVPGGSNEL